MVERLIDGLAIHNPVDGIDDSGNAKFALILLSHLMVYVVFVFGTKSIKIVPNDSFDLL